MTALSTFLARFNWFMRQTGLDTTVINLELFYSRHINGNVFAFIVHLPGDPPVDMVIQLLEFLMMGSPKAQYFIEKIKNHVLTVAAGQPHKKMVLTEEVPASALL